MKKREEKRRFKIHGRKHRLTLTELRTMLDGAPTKHVLAVWEGQVQRGFTINGRKQWLNLNELRDMISDMPNVKLAHKQLRKELALTLTGIEIPSLENLQPKIMKAIILAVWDEGETE